MKGEIKGRRSKQNSLLIAAKHPKERSRSTKDYWKLAFYYICQQWFLCKLLVAFLRLLLFLASNFALFFNLNHLFRRLSERFSTFYMNSLFCLVWGNIFFLCFKVVSDDIDLIFLLSFLLKTLNNQRIAVFQRIFSSTLENSRNLSPFFCSIVCKNQRK